MYSNKKYWNSQNASEWAYWPICCSGRDCSVLHYHLNNKCMKDGDFVLCDLGGKRFGICSDITTTFPVSGKFSKKQKEIYDITLKAQLESIKALMPGKKLGDIQDDCFKILLEGLRDLGILKGDVQQLFEQKIYGYFMPHSIGHYIGFKTHDVGFKREQPVVDPNNSNPESPAQPVLTPEQLNMYEPVTRDVLRAGVVTTIEPGIYFIEILKEKAKSKPELAEYFDFDKYEEYMEVGGVRIEDDIWVTENGFDMLTVVR
jgi:Xaa-Pro dipeptidase